MIEKKLLSTLKDNYKSNEADRREIGAAANGVLFDAKKTIFAIQKNNFKEAAVKLAAIETALVSLEKRFGFERLRKEGSYKAAAEEYVEARTFFDIIKKKKITAVTNVYLDYESYLGGVCDLIGELVRYATNRAAAGKFNEVAKIKKIADDIMAQLVDFDLTGYLRTKYDQARGHLRKLEQMSYEIRIRGKK